MSIRFGRLIALGLALAIGGCGTAEVGTTSSPNATTSSSASPTTTASATTTAVPTATWPRNIFDVPGEFSILEPGTYYLEPESIPVRVLYTISADGWQSWIGAGKPEQRQDRGYRHVAVSIVNVTNLVIDGCTDHRAADPPVGPTVDDLATALASLPPFLVTKPPSDVDIYGYHGTYLELTVPDIPVTTYAHESFFPDCADRELKSWIGRPLSFAFYGYTEPGQHEEFWILDVEGRRLVIEANWSPDSPKKDVAEMRAILDSIQIEP